MKTIKGSLIIIFAIISLLISGCTSGEPEPSALDPTSIPEVEDSPQEIDEPEAVSPFTIQAEEGLKDPISLLYNAYFDGELPFFVEENPDLLVSLPEDNLGIHDPIPATFLPDGVLTKLGKQNEIDGFIDFALSPDGQEILIEGNYLPATLNLIDQAGNDVEIQLPVRRVLSAYGPATAIIYTIDGEDRFVSASYLGARDPLGSSVMEKIDPRFPDIKGDEIYSQSVFSIEQAATLDPDLIIANARSAWLESAAELDIPIFLVDAESPERLKEAVSLTGQVFGPHSTARAQAWIRYFDEVEAQLVDQTSEVPREERTKVLFTGTEPLRVVSGDMFQTFIIESAGGVSVSSELGGYWNDVNLETVVLWAPDVIIVPPYGGASVEAITDSTEWQILDAVKAGKVYRMPKLVVPWDTPAPDTVLGMVWMAQRLYLQGAPFDCSQETEFFYRTFYDYQITDEELGKICSFD